MKAFSSDGASTGKRYFEVTVDTFAGGNNGIGICQTNGVTYPNLGAQATDAAMVYPSGNIWIAGSSSGHGLGSVPSGHVVGIAVDLSAHLIWFKDITAGTNWNGTVGADPATGTSGLTIQSGTFVPAVVFTQFSSAQATYNFGASGFTGSVPSGFASGWLAVVTSARVTTLGAEVLADGGTATKARVSTLGAQVLADGGTATKSRVSTLGVQVLRTVSNAVPNRQPVIIICT